MLSLKYSTHKCSSSLKRLDELPTEILDSIIEYVFFSSDRQVSSVIPASLSCRRLRSSSIAILFEDLYVLADNRGFSTRSYNVVEQLILRPHLLQLVRRLHVLTPLNEAGHSSGGTATQTDRSKSLLWKALSGMGGLRQLVLDHISPLTMRLIEKVFDNTNFRITLQLQYAKSEVSSQICANDHRETLTHCNSAIDLSFPPIKSHHVKDAALRIALLSTNIIALNSEHADEFIYNLGGTWNPIRNLQELCIPPMSVEVLEHFMRIEVIPWDSLRKLQLQGDRQIRIVRAKAIRRLKGLTHLRLHAYRTNIFHSGCPSNTLSQQDHENLFLTDLPNLRHLELFNLCNHIRIEQIAVPTLRSLRLQIPEYSVRLSGRESARPPSQIRWLGKNVPNLETLEVHIGDLENLWHPTAIPGVDVDVEVYQFLQALANLPKLRQLRLFPPSVPRTASNNFVVAKQPLSDEQAVRIFRHLKSQCSSLQMLSIAATLERSETFDPMSWVMRSHSDKTVLTTRQAGRNYEIEQIWVGERRESMSNRRFTHQKPYLPDLNDWTYPILKAQQPSPTMRTLTQIEENDDL